MAASRQDIRWAAKAGASTAFCLAGAVAGAFLYFGNLTYVRGETPSSAALPPGLVEPPNAELPTGHSWQTPQLKMTMKSTGQLVITGSNGKTRWSSPTNQSGSWATIQGDGNFVIYSHDHIPLWATNTTRNPSSNVYLDLEADGAIRIIYNGVAIYTFPGT
jgi:hypothetical protein